MASVSPWVERSGGVRNRPPTLSPSSSMQPSPIGQPSLVTFTILVQSSRDPDTSVAHGRGHVIDMCVNTRVIHKRHGQASYTRALLTVQTWQRLRLVRSLEVLIRTDWS